jgi:hypothetical protein
MVLLKVQSKVLSTALQDKEMHMLRMYLDSFQRTEDGCFVCQEVNDPNDGIIPDIRLSIFDYTFNERESKKIWQIAKETIGKETIDLKTISRVVL